jgi:hypothetical protein
MQADYFRTQGNRYLVPLAIRIPGSAIVFPEQGATRIDFIASVKNVTGAVAATVRDNIEIGPQADLASRTIHYQTSLVLTPGPYNLKFVTRENTTGKMGTFEASIFVPDLATEVDYLPISSVVLANPRDNANSAAANTRPVPSVTRVFRTDQPLLVYLEKYHPAGATIRIGFYQGGTKTFETEPFEIGSDPARISVPLAGLNPGRYTCQVSVLAPAARKFAFWRAPVALIR